MKKLLSLLLIFSIAFVSCDKEDVVIEKQSLEMPIPLEVDKKGNFIVNEILNRNGWRFQCGNSNTGEQIHVNTTIPGDPQWYKWNGTTWESISGIYAHNWCTQNDPYYFASSRITLEDLKIMLAKSNIKYRGKGLYPVDIHCSNSQYNQVIWEDESGNYHLTYQDPYNSSNYITVDISNMNQACQVLNAGGSLIS